MRSPVRGERILKPAAKLNAAFIGLRARLATLPPAQAVTEALRFTREGAMLASYHAQTNGEGTSLSYQLPSARQQWETLSEAGLPLVNLSFGEALRYARATGPSEELWSAIPDQVLRAPSPLVPALLNQLEEIAGTNGALQAGVGAWRTLWNARLKLYEMADLIRQSGKLRGPTTANLWIAYDESRWLCVLNPERSMAMSSTQGGTNHLISRSEARLGRKTSSACARGQVSGCPRRGTSGSGCRIRLHLKHLKKPGTCWAFLIQVTLQAKKRRKRAKTRLDYRKLSVKVSFTDKWCCFASGQ